MKKSMEFNLTEFPAMQAFAVEASRVLSHGDLKNYMSIEMFDASGNKFELRVQRIDGKTPAQLASDAQEEASSLRAELAALKEAARQTAEKDLSFLQELEGRIDSSDITKIEYARQMVADWIEELAALVGEG